MDEEKLDKIRKMVANESHSLAQPVDVDALISEGILKQVGKSLYVESLSLLPEHARKKIKTSSKGRHGLRVEFYKERKSMAELAEKFKQFRD